MSQTQTQTQLLIAPTRATLSDDRKLAAGSHRQLDKQLAKTTTCIAKSFIVAARSCGSATTKSNKVAGVADYLHKAVTVNLETSTAYVTAHAEKSDAKDAAWKAKKLAKQGALDGRELL